MNLIFMRHGEATDNVKNLISDKEIYWSVLTAAGKASVEKSIENLPKKIDIVYVSPLPRTIQTASLVYARYPDANYVMDNRIREIDYGKYTHQKNNDDLDNTRIKQKNGDNNIRFGEYGENKYEIERRLDNFLKDVLKEDNDKTILIISHGSIISFMKRILNIKSSHLETGQIEIFENFKKC